MKLGIISDIHEDIISLKKAIKIFEKYNCDEIVCLGDIIGFDKAFSYYLDSTDASECISIIEKNCKYVVIGNHDLFAIKKIPKNINGFTFPENWYSLSIRQKKSISKNRVWLYENELPTKINKHEIEYLCSLPEYIIIYHNGKGFFFSHYIYPDLTGSMIFDSYNVWESTQHIDYITKINCICSFSGHMHPTGIVVSNKEEIFQSINRVEINHKVTHYFVPHVINLNFSNGVVIADLKEMCITYFKIKDSL